MNKTKIEWCDSTWNPVTGCLHGCEYCYARRIAMRFGVPQYDNDCHVYTGKVKCYDDAVHTGPYPWGFAPTFHKYRLGEPKKTKNPQNIFVCSMADLFGAWVPEDWIRQVFEACEAAPQHRYLFLTKNPGRYAELIRKGILPNSDRYWYGATFDHSNWADEKAGHDPGDFYFPEMHGRNTFISFEPLLRDFNIGSASARWFIIGAETGNRKNKITPQLEWVEHITEFGDKNGIAVFMKDSLIPIVGEENMRREWPEGLRR